MNHDRDDGHESGLLPFQRLAEPIEGELHADTQADLDRHAVSRAAFLNCLKDDPSVEGRFETWDRMTGLLSEAHRVADLADSLVAELGWSSRNELFRRGTGREGLPDHVPLELAWDVIRGVQNLPLGAAAKETADDAMHLVRDVWGLPYPWLACDLLNAFRLSALAIVFDQPIRIGLAAKQTAVPAPPMDFSFQARDGETTAELRERLAAVCSDVLAQLDAVERARSLPQGHVKNANRSYGLWARWFYQRHILGWSVHRIAREYRAERSADGITLAHDPRGTIQHGLKEVDRVLGLSTFTWRGRELQ